MKLSKKVLLASHGTEGAQAAESAAMKLCADNAIIHHLIVVPDLWKGMMGDDWLNNEASRDRFGRYLESQLGQEVDEHCKRISDKAEQKGLRYKSEIVLGKPEKCLINACNENKYDIVVMGSPRPKGTSGIRSRMKIEPLVRNLSIPLLIVPYPDD